MSRNASGTFSLVAGNPVATNTLIASAWANNTMTDLATGLTDSLSRSGSGGMLAPLKGVNGTAALPAFSFTNFPDQGLYAAATGDVRMSVAGVDQMRWKNNVSQIWNNTTLAWENIITDTTVFALPVYDTVAVVKATELTVGTYITTKGYSAIDDGGGATYIIAATQTVDEYGNFTLANGNVALIKHEQSVLFEQFGAVGDGVTDDHAALQAMLTFAQSDLDYVSGTEGKTYALSEVLILGEDGGDAIEFRNAKLHGLSSFTILLVLLGDVTNVSFTTAGASTTATTIGIEIGDYPTYPTANLATRITDVRGNSAFYNFIKSEIELDNTVIDGVIYFKDVGDAVISLTDGNPVDTSRSANLQIIRIHLSNSGDKPVDYSKDVPDVGVRLTATEDCSVEGIINSYDIAFDSSGTTGGVGENRNLTTEFHRDSHIATGSRTGDLWDASTAYALDDYVYPTTAQSAAVGYVFKCTTAGTTGATEPTWDTTYLNTTADGTAVWQRRYFTSAFKLGNDAGVTIKGGQLLADNAGVVAPVATVVHLYSPMPCARGVLVAVGAGIVDFNAYNSLSGEIGSTVRLMVHAGAEYDALGAIKSSTYSTHRLNAPRVEKYVEATVNYNVLLSDGIVYVKSISGNIQVTVPNDQNGKVTKIYNAQAAHTVQVRATAGFEGITSGANLTTAGQFAEVMAFAGAKCILISNGTIV